MAATAPRPANRLAGETSPYLLQHAHNPVDWYPWGPEALGRAVELDRPIFLSIGYAACHWCHVMERESFEDPETAAFLNAHFVAIKVDREERPDLDALYMGAVQAITGQGGWPMSVFLTPEGRPVLRRHLLPGHAAPRDAVVPPGARGRAPRLVRAARASSRRRAGGWSQALAEQQRAGVGGAGPAAGGVLAEARRRDRRGVRSRSTGAGAARPSSPSR